MDVEPNSDIASSGRSDDPRYPSSWERGLRSVWWLLEWEGCACGGGEAGPASLRTSRESLGSAAEREPMSSIRLDERLLHVIALSLEVVSATLGKEEGPAKGLAPR